MQAVKNATAQPPSLTSALQAHIAQAIDQAGGWIGFDRFMELALYTPGLGYYAGDLRKFGAMPQSGSDFVTAPEMTPLFGQTLAVQVAEALARTGTDEIWEFGAGSGALAAQLIGALEALGKRRAPGPRSATPRRWRAQAPMKSGSLAPARAHSLRSCSVR